ncbi:MAG: hypothetical protein IKT34_02600, partial [Clostridia bacterium]|nr:hypothetical protein [Clostridia bacterium]
NHITFIDNEFSATTTQIMDIIELSDKPSVVQGVRADGKSIATSVVTVNSASGKNVSIAVSGYSKYTIIKYELYQGTRLISTIKTNATDATFNVAASAFEEGETVVVRMHSSDGNMVATALNIDVVKLAKINENQVLTELSDISMDVNMGGLGSFKFELPFTSSDAPNLKVYTEGRSIYVGINMDPKDIVTKKLSKSDIVKAIDKTIKSDAFDDVDASLDFCGYLEIEYLGEGEYYIKSSYVKMSVAVNFETQIQASFYGIVGVYFKVGIGASGELELKIARFEPDSGFAFEQADITLETIRDLEGGVYLLWGAGSAGFYGTITIGFTIGVVPVTQWKQVYAEGDFGLRWSVLWGMIKGQYSVVSGDFFRWTNDGAKSMMAQIRRAMSDPSNYTQNDRSYLENRSEWLSGIEENTLQTSIYGEVAPKIVTCGDTTMMVWLDDNSERDFDNFQTLYYSVYNDGIWSSPVAVDNNETFDCEFDVYSDGNAIYVIYTEMLSRYVDMQSIDISDPAAIQALIGNVEVMATVYENGKFSDPVRLTNNAICEQMPVIGEVDGYITAAWLESNSMGIDDAEYENNLVTSVLDVIGWTKPETIVSGNKTISEIVCFSLDGNEYLAYVVDGDGNSDTVDDKMLVLREENGDSVQLDSGAIASVALSCVAGGEVLTWYNGNQLYMMTSTDDAPISLLPESVIGSRNYQIVPIDFEKSLLLFTDNTETEGSDIFGMYIGADGAISSPVRMTESEGYIASYAVYTVNGDYFVVYNETHATVTENDVNTVSNLKIAELDFGCDIKIDHVEYDLTEAYPENDFELHFALTNEGSAPVDGVRMNFFDPFGALIYTADVDAVLASGESGEIEFSILLPKSIAAEAYTAEILPISKMAVVPDSDPEGNRVEIMLAFSDMSISAEQKIIGEKNYVLFSVTNEGNTASTAMLYVYAEGRLIADLKTDSISPATSSQYLIDINALTTAEDKILTCSVKSDFNDNCELNDNDSLCLLHIEDSTLAVDPDDALRNPELSEYTFEFDKYTPENIELLIISEADYFKSITGLTKDVDYTVDYDALTINSSVFAGLDEGIHSFDLVFDFNGASVSRTVTVSVSDTTPITINGSISIIGEIVVGGVVYADISGLTPTRPEVDYVWTINGVTVGNDREYLIKPEDYGKKLVLTVSAREGYVGSFNYEADVTMRKAETPSLPVISRVDCDEIALVRIDGVEYSLDGVSWQTENVFTALLP